MTHRNPNLEELVLEEGVVDVSEVVGAEVEAAQNNLAQMEEEVAKAKELVADATEADGQEKDEEMEESGRGGGGGGRQQGGAGCRHPLQPPACRPQLVREEWRETQPITREKVNTSFPFTPEKENMLTKALIVYLTEMLSGSLRCC